MKYKLNRFFKVDFQILITEIMYVKHIMYYKNLCLQQLYKCIIKMNYMSLHFNNNYVPCLQTLFKFRHSQIIPAFGHFFICQSTNLSKVDQAGLQVVMKGSKCTLSLFDPTENI